MERVLDSDAEAFAELYDRHAQLAFRVARSICRDPGRAEDAVQDGFLDVWRNRGSYQRQRGAFKAWAISVVRHRAIDSLRRDAIRPRAVSADDVFELGATNGQGPDHDLIVEDDREAVRRAIASLPEPQAEVIILAFYGEISHAEIAAHLGIPAGTVKGRMRLGLEKLRREMTRDALRLPAGEAGEGEPGGLRVEVAIEQAGERAP